MGCDHPTDPLLSQDKTVENVVNYKSKLANFVEGGPKVFFSIATTPRCRGGRYSIPTISPLYPWSSPYSAASSTIFWVFGMTCPGIELLSSGPLANTLLTRWRENINFPDLSNLLDKRSEFVPKCCHESKYLLCNFALD